MPDDDAEFLRTKESRPYVTPEVPEYINKERDRILQALRDTQPSFIRNPPGQNVTVAKDSRAEEWNQNGIQRTRADIFTPPETPAIQQSVSESIPNIAFIVSDATVVEGDPPVTSNKVLVADGKINADYPAGMPSDNTYTIDLSDPADSLIYAGITFNPTTLAINSRFLGVSGSGDFPESRVESATSGFIYWLLAFTYFDDDGNFKVVNVRVGNIDFAFSYGAMNGQPALLPIDSQPGWLDLESLF